MIWRKVVFKAVSYNGLKFSGSVSLNIFFFRRKKVEQEIKQIIFEETGIFIESVNIIDVYKIWKKYGG